jgi:hypothetical protein
VRPEGIVLEDHADVALVGRQSAHHPVAEADLAGVGLVEAGQEAEEGGLAAAGGAEQGEQLAVGDGQIGAVDRGGGAEALGDLRDVDVDWIFPGVASLTGHP